MTKRGIDAIWILIIAGVILVDRIIRHRRSTRESKLLERGVKICGEVCHVHYEWVGRRYPSMYYELYAKFEYDGETHYALRKCRHKPDFQAGDPIGICFDPDDPDENMILDFPDRRIEI